jgi:hypothetical protein
MHANDGKLSDSTNRRLRRLAAKKIYRHLHIQVQPPGFAQDLQCHLPVVWRGQDYFVDKAGA